MIVVQDFWFALMSGEDGWWDLGCVSDVTVTTRRKSGLYLQIL